ncbi:MAG: cache domain-containing protein [Planctomycetota bacterium]
MEEKNEPSSVAVSEQDDANLQQEAPGNTEVSVTSMVDELSVALESAIGEIHAVNSETKVLSLNARIEAARAGAHGAAFGVVAEEMQSLSEKTEQIASVMANRTREKTGELMSMIDSTVRGTRLSDLALVNVDLIDRNLFERTCDVRWWATDGSIVDALADPTPEKLDFASKRMGVILSAYTVYHDLVLANSKGQIVANGFPKQYSSSGQDVGSADWFRQAIQSSSGDEWGFQTAHLSRLVDQKPSLVYSASVRTDGDQRGTALGALGVIFNWSDLAGPILKDIPVSSHEETTTRAFIADGSGKVLASRENEKIGDSVPIPEFQRVLSADKGFYITTYEETKLCVGHAKAPSFEGYSTGWYSIVAQPLVD